MACQGKTGFSCWGGVALPACFQQLLRGLGVLEARKAAAVNHLDRPDGHRAETCRHNTRPEALSVDGKATTAKVSATRAPGARRLHRVSS